MNPSHAFLLGIGCTLIVEALAGIVLMAFLTRQANRDLRSFRHPVKEREGDA